VMRSLSSLGLAAFALAGGFVLAHAHMPPPSNFQVTRFYAKAEPDAKTPVQTDITSGRTAMWKITAQQVLGRPLFGHGESQFRTHPVTRQFSLFHPHNSVIQIAFQWGIIGALCFFALFASVWFSLLRIARQQPEIGLPAFMLINALFAISLIDGAYYYTWSPMMSAFAAAFALGAARSRGRSES
jgi:O-antigen ligase